MTRVSLLFLAVALLCLIAPAFVAAKSHVKPHKAQHVYPKLDLPVPVRPKMIGRDNVAASAPLAAPYNISNYYVLGLSSGGFLAVQMHVAYSSEISGAGIFAAGPYYCAQGSLMTALETCVEALSPVDLSSLEGSAAVFEGLGMIDQLRNLTNQPVYLFHGTSDRTVFAPVNNALYQMYLDYNTNVVYNNNTVANHAWISPSGPNPCTVSQSPYISSCGSLDPEKELIAHLLGSVNPSVTPKGQTYSFSQDVYANSMFGKSANSLSMDSTGYVYIPPQCLNNQTACDMFVVIHGCEQGFSQIGGALMQDSNLNGYADSNNLVILYPQAIASPMLSNPEGCWDWWGYTTMGSTSGYAVHGAPQMEIIRAIVHALGFKQKSAL